MMKLGFKQVNIPLSSVFVEEYMAKAKSPYYSVVYIYGLKCAYMGEEVSNREIASRLGMLPSDVIDAWDYWQEQGLVRLTGQGEDMWVEFLDISSPKVKAQVNSTGKIRDKLPPTYTGEEINKMLQENEELKDVLEMAEQVYAQPFKSADVSAVVSFYVWLGLPAEVIAYLFDYCKGKPMGYIEKTAYDWAEKGLSTVDAAMDYVTVHFTQYGEIMSAFGVGGRSPGDRERRIMDGWLYSLKMPMELIKLACDRTLVKTGKIAWEYADSILKNWHKQGILSLKQVEAADAEHEKARSTSKTKSKTSLATPSKQVASRPQVAQTKFVNYDQPVYTDDMVDDIVERNRQRRMSSQ